MEQYLDAKVKRYVQNKLFSHINKAKTILGLAGTHPEEYIKVLPYHKQVVLVDFNPVNAEIRKNSLIGEFDILNQNSNYPPITFVDCDFCKSILNCGPDLIYICSKMKNSKIRNKYISFTFSLRGVELEKTFDWLLTNFPELYIQSPKNLDLSILQHRQYVKEWSPVLFGYRDSGDNMISGIIKL